VDGTAPDTPPRILAVADGWPWTDRPTRAARILAGLAAAGEVDLCVLVPSPGPPPTEAEAALRRSCREHATVAARAPVHIDRLFGGGHDQVWYLTPRALELVGRRPAARIVVDLGAGADPTRAERRRIRRDADLVLTGTDGPAAPDPTVAVSLPTGDALPRTVAALARTGAVPITRRHVGLDLRAEGLVA
jgi:hypothetical protein